MLKLKRHNAVYFCAIILMTTSGFNNNCQKKEKEKEKEKAASDATSSSPSQSYKITVDAKYLAYRDNTGTWKDLELDNCVRPCSFDVKIPSDRFEYVMVCDYGDKRTVDYTLSNGSRISQNSTLICPENENEPAKISKNVLVTINNTGCVDSSKAYCYGTVGLETRNNSGQSGGFDVVNQCLDQSYMSFSFNLTEDEKSNSYPVLLTHHENDSGTNPTNVKFAMQRDFKSNQKETQNLDLCKNIGDAQTISAQISNLAAEEKASIKHEYFLWMPAISRFGLATRENRVEEFEVSKANTSINLFLVPDSLMMRNAQNDAEFYRVHSAASGMKKVGNNRTIYYDRRQSIYRAFDNKNAVTTVLPEINPWLSDVANIFKLREKTAEKGFELNLSQIGSNRDYAFFEADDGLTLYQVWVNGLNETKVQTVDYTKLPNWDTQWSPTFIDPKEVRWIIYDSTYTDKSEGLKNYYTRNSLRISHHP